MPTARESRIKTLGGGLSDVGDVLSLTGVGATIGQFVGVVGAGLQAFGFRVAVIV